MRIVVMPGDGIGPEITAAAVKVLGAASERVVGAAREAHPLRRDALEWLSIRHANDAFARAHASIESAVDALLADPARRTADLGGKLGTDAFSEALCEELRRRK